MSLGINEAEWMDWLQLIALALEVFGLGLASFHIFNRPLALVVSEKITQSLESSHLRESFYSFLKPSGFLSWIDRRIPSNFLFVNH